MIRSPLLASLTLCLTLGALPCQAALDDAEAINRAGQQRMLSQRVAKSYLMIGTETRAELAMTQLDSSVASVEENSALLGDYAPNAAIRGAVDEASGTWLKFRERALGKPDKESSLEVLRLAERFLAQSESLVQRIEQHNGTPAGHLVNRSGRLRMLSQRIAMLYLALSWNLPEPGLEREFVTAVEEFDQGLAELRGAKQNSATINQRLEQIGNQWRFARAGFQLAEQSRYVPTVIVTTSDSLLQKLEALTADYATLAQAKR
ncbi:type IV pili methyl-accepting chemotaxis transducer N-terminal domain-containing protein [Pseudomonas oligotrophica]|uniref:type IV pili methyl-accepting chemotaxis transducer N-terminal domain-containing protein n=1 Tax=Pseudomonas oligotrophica TaxID=2912055 RepID=UPI001F1C27F1|nr:type IV pili methyl-accepting chemotaxis transducer N-terminal domain-containing protein [Pseudomonas oligotrophica]MCF7202911.1 type IV pili methyl-accepting chemotaxis transducer N-terminal domain-containing protein [Pseudomonas oligotrophica]